MLKAGSRQCCSAVPWLCHDLSYATRRESFLMSECDGAQRLRPFCAARDCGLPIEIQGFQVRDRQGAASQVKGLQVLAQACGSVTGTSFAGVPASTYVELGKCSALLFT